MPPATALYVDALQLEVLTIPGNLDLNTGAAALALTARRLPPATQNHLREQTHSETSHPDLGQQSLQLGHSPASLRCVRLQPSPTTSEQRPRSTLNTQPTCPPLAVPLAKVLVMSFPPLQGLARYLSWLAPMGSNLCKQRQKAITPRNAHSFNHRSITHSSSQTINHGWMQLF